MHRFSLSIIFMGVAFVAALVAWYSDREELKRENARLSFEVAVLESEEGHLWSTEKLVERIDSSDFDPTSKRLYAALLGQEESFKSGLIAYLGLDRYRGSINSCVTRTVWWSRRVEDRHNGRFIIFLADKDRWGEAVDSSAYIVTDDNYRLIHWQGTKISRDSTIGILGRDRLFPLSLKQRVKSRGSSMFFTCVDLDLKLDVQSVSGERAN